jgi:cytoplasmic tRNA 2-thiolation protein 1
MTLLNDRHDYGLDLCLLSIDEGIAGYRDHSLDVSELLSKSLPSSLCFLSHFGIPCP